MASSTNPEAIRSAKRKTPENSDWKNITYIFDFVVNPPDLSAYAPIDTYKKIERNMFKRELERILIL